MRSGRGFDATAEGLWVTGSLAGLGRVCVALVGTRAATRYGRATTRRFAADLGNAGCCILSGLALGIDGAAHEAALEARAPTIGVLGGGHEHFFPRRHRELAEQMIAAGGAVVSPYPPQHDTRPFQFLARNGIVAALADAVVVIEAPARSGALNTAGWAAGRVPVLAVPGDVDRAHAAGCLALIRDGATLARDARDVLEALGIPIPLPALVPVRSRGPVAEALLGALDRGARTFDELLVESSAAPADALAALTLLDLDGTIESRGPSSYARVGTPSRGEEPHE